MRAILSADEERRWKIFQAAQWARRRPPAPAPEPAPRTAYYQSPGGAGDYAEASTALAAATIFPGAGDVQPFAFLLWVKRAVTDTFDEYLFQVACAVNGNFLTYMSDPNNDNYLQASLADGTASASGSVQYPSPDLESWALVAYAFDGVDTLSVYINGALVTQPSSSPALDWLGAGVSMTLLADSGHGSQLDASIRNIHIFDRALASGEIAALYAAGPTHNVRAASGAWAGETALVSWDTAAVGGVVLNTGSGGTCGLTLNGAVTSEVDP